MRRSDYSSFFWPRPDDGGEEGVVEDRAGCPAARVRSRGDALVLPSERLSLSGVEVNRHDSLISSGVAKRVLHIRASRNQEMRGMGLANAYHLLLSVIGTAQVSKVCLSKIK